MLPTPRRANSDDRPLFGGGSAPVLRPPVAFSDAVEPSKEPSKASTLPQAAPRPQPPIVVVPAPGAVEAAARACPACSARAMPYVEVLWSLLQPLQACGGQSSVATDSPDMEVAANGEVTYEWKGVVERQKSLGSAISADDLTRTGLRP
eukprot:TRINITY_DN30623_c0_g1_i1.p1 TRINITY_DN30623_c0_g1~~TRINITY_DN30623_c0_g1_i1.p1  ORF type:complete len:149 (-),score=32.22 TRINITY_DN30623_c0_g1_i1:54-500(-)